MSSRSEDDGLEVRGVTKSFGGVKALREVDAELGRGEVVGLVGPNGSGKTTLLNVISGVITPDAGVVLVDGEEITGLPADRIAHRGVARTFQNIRLFGELTVLENVEAGASLAGANAQGSVRRRALDDLDEIALAELKDRPAATLAYGAQRRLELARGLATHPRYLLLDEPAAGMNETESDALREAISVMRSSRGMGILVIDHDLRLIMRLCDRVIALNEGRVIAVGSPTAIQADPAVIEAFLGTGHASNGAGGAEVAGAGERRG